jgi:hypothetical protein
MPQCHPPQKKNFLYGISCPRMQRWHLSTWCDLFCLMWWKKAAIIFKRSKRRKEPWKDQNCGRTQLFRKKNYWKPFCRCTNNFLLHLQNKSLSKNFWNRIKQRTFCTCFCTHMVRTGTFQSTVRNILPAMQRTGTYLLLHLGTAYILKYHTIARSQIRNSFTLLFRVRYCQKSSPKNLTLMFPTI